MSPTNCRPPAFFGALLVVAATFTRPCMLSGETILGTIVEFESGRAIEVFRRPSEVPARYGGAESGCGVILIWTLRGAVRNRGRY